MKLDSSPPLANSENADGVAARLTPFGRSANFRHLGGYRAAVGKITRGDLLFRSGWLQLNGPADVTSFEKIGIRRIIDFRNQAEVAAKPFALPGIGSADIVNLPVQHGSMAGFLQSLAAGSSSSADTRQAMASMYREMIELGADQFRAFFRGAAASDGALLVACSLGKDRTGVASGLLLAALGVSEGDIFADYLISDAVYRTQSESLYASMSFAARGIPLDLVRDVLTVNAEYLRAAWEEMIFRYGSIDAYLEQRLGLSDDMRAELQRKFTR